jgi:hypothetical protein
MDLAEGQEVLLETMVYIFIHQGKLAPVETVMCMLKVQVGVAQVTKILVS